jgi:hypothetical protein
MTGVQQSADVAVAPRKADLLSPCRPIPALPVGAKAAMKFAYTGRADAPRSHAMGSYARY